MTIFYSVCSRVLVKVLMPDKQPHLELGATPVHQAPGAQTMVLGQLDGHLLHLPVPAYLELHLRGIASALPDCHL